MKKFIIILTSLIIGMGAGMFGAFLYITHPSKEYELKNYSFKAPDSIECIGYTTNQWITYKFFGEKIFVRDIDENCDLETAKEFVNKISEDAKFEKLEGYPYDGYYYTAKIICWELTGNKDVHIGYILGTDTNYFNIYCECSPSKAKIIKPVIEKIAKTAKYTSDFRLAEKPDVYDCEYLSVYTGSKYYCRECDDTYTIKPDHILALEEKYANTNNPEKIVFPNLDIKVYDNGKSPAELADDRYNSSLELNENDEKFYDVVTRDQKDMFGLKCEHVFVIFQKEFYYDEYYFSKGKYTYRIEAGYIKNQNYSDEADIKEMLDGITIKDIK